MSISNLDTKHRIPDSKFKSHLKDQIHENSHSSQQSEQSKVISKPIEISKIGRIPTVESHKSQNSNRLDITKPAMRSMPRLKDKLFVANRQTEKHKESEEKLEERSNDGLENYHLRMKDKFKGYQEVADSSERNRMYNFFLNDYISDICSEKQREDMLYSKTYLSN